MPEVSFLQRFHTNLSKVVLRPQARKRVGDPKVPIWQSQTEPSFQGDMRTRFRFRISAQIRCHCIMASVQGCLFLALAGPHMPRAMYPSVKVQAARQHSAGRDGISVSTSGILQRAG